MKDCCNVEQERHVDCIRKMGVGDGERGKRKRERERERERERDLHMKCSIEQHVFISHLSQINVIVLLLTCNCIVAKQISPQIEFIETRSLPLSQNEKYFARR